jgi:hypothetical protein
MFSYAVLRGCVGAIKMKKNTMGEKENFIGSIIKFVTIITLNKSHKKTTVHESILLKVCKDCVNIQLGTERKGPNIVQIIINNNKMIFETRNTNYRRCPQITME